MKKPRVNKATKYATRKAPARQTKAPTQPARAPTQPAQPTRNAFAGTDQARVQNPQNVGRSRIFKPRTTAKQQPAPSYTYRNIITNDGQIFRATFNDQGKLVLPRGTPYSMNGFGGRFIFGGYSQDPSVTFEPQYPRGVREFAQKLTKVRR